MKKKIITAILALTLVLIMFTGCGGNGVTINIKANPESDFDYLVGQNDITIIGYKGNITDVVIPNKIEGKNVTKIGTTFKEIDWLTSVIIPDGVTTIDRDAFYGCKSLTSVTIGNGVTTIGGGAFADCNSLTSVTIPDGVTTIGGGAFAGCNSLSEETKQRILQINPDNAFGFLSSFSW